MYNYPVTHEFQYICMYRESIYVLTICTIYMYVQRKYLSTNYMYNIYVYREKVSMYELLCTVYMYVQRNYLCTNVMYSIHIYMYVQRKYLCTYYI